MSEFDAAAAPPAAEMPSGTSYQLISAGVLLFAFVWIAVATQALALAVPNIVEDWTVPVEKLAAPMSMAWLGAAIGTLVGGVLGDVWGRKWTVVAALALTALATGAIAVAETPGTLTAIRLVQGIGLGALNPPALALISELVGEKRRGYMISLGMVSGPIGISLCAGLAALVFQYAPWQVLFWVVAAALALGALAAVTILPESPAYLLRREGRTVRVDAINGKLGLVQAEGDLPVTESARGLRSLSAPFSRPFLFQTICVALCFAVIFALMGAALSWLPVLFTGAGYSIEVAASTVPAWSIGGIAGALLAGWAAARFGVGRAGQGLAGLTLASMAALIVVTGLEVTLAVLLVAGLGVSGMVTVLFIYAAQIYPAAIRSTGLGLAETSGRLGAVLGSYAGAFFLTGIASFFLVLAALAAVILLVFWIASRRRAA